MQSMSSPPSPPLPNRPGPILRRRFAFEWRAVLLRTFLPIAALLALPSLGIGALIWWRTSKTWDYRERWSGTWVLAIVGLVVYGAITRAAHPLPSLLHALFVDRRASFLVVSLRGVGEMWLLHLCFAPACALVLEWLHPLTRRVRLLPRYQAPRRGKAGSVSPGRLPTNSSLSLVPASPPSTSSQPSPPPMSLLQASSIGRPPPAEPLGFSLGGDLYEWLRGGQLYLPLEEMWRHGTVVGEPGYGKTMTLLRLATVAVRYGMQVIFLDLKGSKQTAAQFVAAMHMLGVGRIAVYPQRAYDGWRGDANALYNRLMAMIDPGTHPYYRRITSALVSLAVNAPGGPPRSSQEFLARLDEKWLKYAYAGKMHWYAQRKINRLSEHISETSLAYDGFFDGVAGGLDGTFAFEDADAVYIGLDGDALKEQAVGMARYLLEDAAHYAKHRKAPGVRTLCIIDEFGALGISNVAGLYEHMREAGLSMWASAQSHAGLGSERDNVLAASSIKILHRCGDPEELVKFAGQHARLAGAQPCICSASIPFPSRTCSSSPSGRLPSSPGGFTRGCRCTLSRYQKICCGWLLLLCQRHRRNRLLPLRHLRQHRPCRKKRRGEHRQRQGERTRRQASCGLPCFCLHGVLKGWLVYGSAIITGSLQRFITAPAPSLLVRGKLLCRC
jgi:hypothetical protein